MIRYPSLEKQNVVGVTAPSSGVPLELHSMFRKALMRLEEKQYKVICKETVWTQYKAKSAGSNVRAQELNDLLQDEDVKLIFPPWGGELLIEILEYIEFEKMTPKWILGYSDTSALLLAITLKTGIATAHGTNLVDIRGEDSDPTTAMWGNVLHTKPGESILQLSSEKFQEKWDHNNPTPQIFHLTEKTTWKTSDNKKASVRGRLLGGCIDIIRHLVGTPFGNVEKFYENHMKPDEMIIWYFENCELSTTDLRRSLVQLKLAGWFKNCSGIMFGRSAANQPVNQYDVLDVYQELAQELNVPIIYDIDCGHVPPQVTLINGAIAEIEVQDGKGTVVQFFA
ncbi:muramoyltetrapeptide carboxypeptidase LdcA involved in peptidoglycan recycling [Metabacillus crassostreae]|uniref:S66 family peptidase n=1 Tax=Metabacillus crassostreae TaxID=929098 RepID=UPI0019584959|nr:S66 peptidase family protein [Metabacillus crassostreae]MBM7603610.1 muramoyltetrapeptide carboxypeptidase LdcA involved in peptidoglycan recycling [Metabacillus crassostreae]